MEHMGDASQQHAGSNGTAGGGNRYPSPPTPLLVPQAAGDVPNGTESPAHTPGSAGTVPGRRPFAPTREDPLYHKMKYYNRLGATIRTPMTPPPSVLPPELFIVRAPAMLHDLLGMRESPVATDSEHAGAADAVSGDAAPGTQSSLTTIFSIWNTMMGSSVLALPWAFAQAGLWGGLIVIFGIGAVCCYTAVLVTKRAWRPVGGGKFPEFSDMAEHYLGRVGKWASIWNSMLILVGAIIVYNVLLEQAFFGSIDTVIYWISTPSSPPAPEPLASAAAAAVTAVVPAPSGTGFWTTPVASLTLFALLMPLCSLRDITPLIKFNSMGIPLMLFCITFILGDTIFVKGLQLANLPGLESRFFFLAGMLNMSFFIHNVIFSITRNVAEPAKVPRDVAIAFSLVGACYLIVGLTGALAYNNRALGPDSIAQNFLNTYPKTHTFAWLSRTAVFLQLITVFPLLMFITRVQFFESFFADSAPDVPRILVFNLVIIGTGTAFCVFYPQVGTVLRYTGALCGFVYMFLLPILVHWRYLRGHGPGISRASYLGHGALLVLGLAILVNQFSIPLPYLGAGAGVLVLTGIAARVCLARRAAAAKRDTARDPLLGGYGEDEREYDAAY